MSEFSLVCHQQRQRGKIFIQHYCLPSFPIRGTRLSLSLSKSFTVFCPCLSVRVSPFLPPQGADCISMTSLLLRVSNLTKKTSHHTSVCLVHFVSFLYAFLFLYAVQQFWIEGKSSAYLFCGLKLWLGF